MSFVLPFSRASLFVVASAKDISFRVVLSGSRYRASSAWDGPCSKVVIIFLFHVWRFVSPLECPCLFDGPIFFRCLSFSPFLRRGHPPPWRFPPLDGCHGFGFFFETTLHPLPFLWSGLGVWPQVEVRLRSPVNELGSLLASLPRPPFSSSIFFSRPRGA